MHQQGAGVLAAGFLVHIDLLRVQAPQAADLIQIFRTAHHHPGKQNFLFVWADELPVAHKGVYRRVGEAIQVAIVGQVVVFVIVRHLGLGNGLFFFGKLAGVQLKAVAAHKGHIALGGKAGAGAGGNMGPHAGRRIAQGRAKLNGQPLDGVGAVAGPDLGGVVEHARVKAGPAAGTVLQKNVGEGGGDAVHQLIHAQHIAVEELALALGGQHSVAGLGDVPVAVPLNVVDFVLGDHVVHLLEDVVPDLLAGHVQHALVAAERFVPARRLDDPIGMGPVQVAVRVHHFGLIPDAELEPRRVHPLN